jgi:hypothetical protein
VSGPNRFEVNGADARTVVYQERGRFRSACTTDLGPDCAQLDTIACASQRAGGCGRHDGNRARLRRLRRRAHSCG